MADWVGSSKGDIPLGVTRDSAFAQARAFLDEVKRDSGWEAKLSHQTESAELLNGTCQTLFSLCVNDPKAVLAGATTIYAALIKSPWQDDELEEHSGLLCSLAFVAWRSARVLELSHETQNWEATYRRLFRSSLEQEVIEFNSEGDRAPEFFSALGGSEREFQVLLQLQDHADADPQGTAGKARRIYQKLASGGDALPEDIRQYLRGAFARLIGVTLKHGDRMAATFWLDLAESHFRAGVDPEPELARVLFVRLSLLYLYDRPDLILSIVPELDATFNRFGMDEDSVKCRILWSCALKDAGRIEDALSVLDPIRQSRSGIRPGLYGYVLREYGDLHQISGDYARGLSELVEAASVLREEKELVGLPAVISMIGFCYRAQGRLSEAVDLYVKSQEQYAELGMKALEIYSAVLVAETLLEMGRSREAELVVRSLLPTIETEGLVVNAVAAISILREALRRQKLDPQMLRELRERLRPENK